MQGIWKTLLGTVLALAMFGAQAASEQKVRTPFIENWGQVPLAQLERQASQYPGVYFLNGAAEEKVIALTFDDGPSQFTPELLDVLKKHQVKATFFVLGKSVERSPELVKRAQAEGHTIGNHSWDHPNLSEMQGDAYWDKQLKPTQDALKKLLGFEPALMRPPYGFLTDAQVADLGKRKMKAILWSVASDDWFLIHTMTQGSAQAIGKQVQQYAHPGAIVLAHDAGGRTRQPTIEAMDALIPELKKQGYRFVTVDQLLGVKPAL
ncbi:polysaccharide deacetylase family protein [Chitinilyticum piscinae]|uniref:Polysaccharide deacetylase family protein n=1 Tax=Chitinilyticum piscinae TaxID=2866724 RepID=A0A8J7K202_9NEIS|nr:polysaccharide deacetylase family protein [Chitinilyticum piscinae]MBE9609352.1 polysaccharide deacetylase family protein [Chitinilyticum piscinae]